jgi:uncharacterized HAD superfamily protein
MNFRTFNDLQRAVAGGNCLIPPTVDVVVGVPRSGLLAANLFALHRNLPLADLDGFLAGRLLSHGPRLQRERPHLHSANCHALVLDDSLQSGSAMRQARQRIEAAGVATRLTYAAVFGPEGGSPHADVCFEVCPSPRIFQWNLMNSGQLHYTCLDIDGVLCHDPTEDQNDDGPAYAAFLRDARPLHLPSARVSCLVTCRLEKYRAQTQDWLARHGVAHGELVMLDLPSAKARRRMQGIHSSFKAEVYRARRETLFVESGFDAALGIAAQSGKPVFCTDAERFIEPSMVALIRRTLRRTHWATATRTGRMLGRCRRRLQNTMTGWWHEPIHPLAAGGSSSGSIRSHSHS